ncbi:hypothetical protein OHB14_36640 [Streptomyces sp. NBC_01613]|uniref:hypothetical protein n=1 Tax=Streptomyces sp. NBC_01613 TaxID=2975896 RepID=UPI00386E9A0A
MSPVAGTTRYLCPLECGWHHDRPPFPDAWIPAHATTPIAPEAIQRMASEALRQDAEQTEVALREHLATHTTEQFVRTIQGLRAEVARLKRAAEPAPW